MNHRILLFLVVLCCCVSTVTVMARTIQVPVMAPTIQAGIDSANSGDTVLLASGTYTGDGNRDIFFSGKAVTVIGGGKENTYIDVQNQPIPAFTLYPGEANGVSIANVTIRHAENGLYISDAYPRLQNVRFFDNQIAINYIRYDPLDTVSHLTVEGIDFIANDTGVYILSGADSAGPVAVFTNCLFSNNSRGFAYYSNEPSPNRHVNFTDCTFRNNGTAITSYDFVFYQELVVDSSAFENNSTSISNSITVSNSSFTGGQYAVRGFLSSRVVLDNCQFTGITNTVLRSNVFNNSSQSSPPPDFNPGFYVTNCSFTNNPGDIASLGGFINEDPVGASFVSCQFTGNGGGIFGIEGLHEVSLVDCLYANNDDGIEMRASGNGLTITGCTFANNQGTAIDSWLDDWSVNISRTIFSGHSGSAIRFSHFSPNSHWSISCSDFFENDGGDCVGIPSQVGINGNFASDPLYCNGDAGMYTLFQQSPCLMPTVSCTEQVGALTATCQFTGVDSLTIDTLTDNQHVVANTPRIVWRYPSEAQASQTAAEIQVGNDADWSSAELWSSGILFITDSFVTYDGSALIDGHTYYIRVRLAHNMLWSDWHESSFRMNNAPTTPVPVSPSGISISNFAPTLSVLNATDADSDTLYYEFQVFSDSMFTALVAHEPMVTQLADTTTWTVNPPLIENDYYWWRVRSTDQREPSAWSATQMFWVNSNPEVPAAPTTIFPPDMSGLPVYAMKPTFTWLTVVDPDPFDTIRYTFELSTDSSFATSLVVDSLLQPHIVLADSLAFNTEYWWRVSAFDLQGNRSTSVAGTPFWTWTLGDINHSNTVTIGDVTVLVAFLFNNGEAPNPLFVADVNRTCTANILDLTYLVGYLFRSGPALKIGCN